MIQPMEITYVAMRAVVQSDMRALNATVEPMIMRDIAIEKKHVKMIALTGMCRVGWIYSKH